MASFEKRGDKFRFIISIPGEKKPFKSKTIYPSEKAAKTAASIMEEEMRKGFNPLSEEISFYEYFKEWMNVYKKIHITKNTYGNYEDTANSIKEYFEGKTIQSITKREYQAFLNKYATNHAKESTRKLNYHIKSCVKNAIEEGLINTNFTNSAIITGQNKTKTKEEKFLDYNEAKLLLRYLHEKLEEMTDKFSGNNNDRMRILNYTSLFIALASGIRFGELIGLTTADIDFLNNMIDVNKTWGYTNRMHTGFGPTKNEQSVRKVRVDTKTLNLLKKVISKVMIQNINKLIFYSPGATYQVLSNASPNNLLKELKEELNIKQISMHGLRHTHASILLYQGVSVYYVSERLGHNDIQTTLKTYAHIVKELREKDEQKTIKVFSEMA